MAEEKVQYTLDEVLKFIEYRDELLVKIEVMDNLSTIVGIRFQGKRNDFQNLVLIGNGAPLREAFKEALNQAFNEFNIKIRGIMNQEINFLVKTLDSMCITADKVNPEMMDNKTPPLPKLPYKQLIDYINGLDRNGLIQYANSHPKLDVDPDDYDTDDVDELVSLREAIKDRISLLERGKR